MTTRDIYKRFPVYDVENTHSHLGKKLLHAFFDRAHQSFEDLGLPIDYDAFRSPAVQLVPGVEDADGRFQLSLEELPEHEAIVARLRAEQTDRDRVTEAVIAATAADYRHIFSYGERFYKGKHFERGHGVEFPITGGTGGSLALVTRFLAQKNSEGSFRKAERLAPILPDLGTLATLKSVEFTAH